MFTPWCPLGSTLHYPSRGAAAADCLLNLCTDVTCIQQNHVHVGRPATQSRNTNLLIDVPSQDLSSKGLQSLVVGW